MTETFRRGGYLISTAPGRLDPTAVYRALSKTYWAEHRPKPRVAKSLKHSLCFGLYKGEDQIGLTRVITDYATYAYLCDVYVESAHQGRGLGKWLINCVMKSRILRGVKSWSLATRDAHGLYRRFGFRAQRHPKKWMSLRRP